ncbi:hypothetical protein ES319_D09G070400v1 [Gossypium barbadense]|uniref:Uncharacterized protein n=2 Tax=Gossypium TaxID=3633 RepID=A0A5J5Q040_GOSBA|nr:hypothetical protein ES319_D09G070400v1 [Gossypium barbadense]TYG53102.1 hypothetical protein ES288_D09G082800v1 [Gossypium darwinii]
METMNKRFSRVSLVAVLLVLIAVQVNGFFPFDYESEFAQNSLDFQNFPSNSDSDENSLFSESHVYEPQSQYFHQVNPEETSLLSQSELPHDSFQTQNFESTNLPFETQQFPFEINANHRIKSPSPSPAPSPVQVSSPAPSPVEVPSPAPSPVEALHPPKPNPDNICKLKCSTKCLKQEIPILHNLCCRVCKLRCLYHYADLIYTCTNRCAESMPNTFKSDEKKEAAYVKYCYKKCTKNF